MGSGTFFFSLSHYVQNLFVTSRHQSASEETEENTKKSLKIVMFDSQESRVNRSRV